MVATAAHARSWRSIAARSLRDSTGAASVEDAIRTLASGALEGIHCPPTDLDALCAKVGVSACASADLMGAGALVNEGAGPKIIYASDLGLPRRRFTIAHELGHLFIENVSPPRASASKELERLCDMFATEILLPRPEFLPTVSGEFHLSALPNVARAFQVSLTTAALRLAELRRVSVFEVINNDVSWGTGLVRRGSLRTIDEVLQPAIQKALSGQTGTDQVYLNIDGSIRLHGIEYWPLGKPRRALFLIRRIAPASQEPQL
jgi:IrrE N-terminal-like domain